MTYSKDILDGEELFLTASLLINGSETIVNQIEVNEEVNESLLLDEREEKKVV